MANYQNVSNYNKLLREAAFDTTQFSESEINAIRGAWRILVCQDEKVYPWQKQVGNHRGEMKFDVQNYTVYLGSDQKKESMFIDIEAAPHNWINGYHMCGDRPIREIREPGKWASAWKYDWETGNFIVGDDYLEKVYHSTSDVEEVGEEEFLREVRKHREKDGLLEKWDRGQETLPYPRIMEAVNRIARINWKKTYASQFSQAKLLHEFYKRISRYTEEIKVPKPEDFIALLDSRTCNSNALMGHTHTVLSEITNQYNQMICRWYLEWILFCELEEKGDNPLKNPFEPLIYLFERGANFEPPEAKLLHFYESQLLTIDIPIHWKKQSITEFDYDTLEGWDNNQNQITMDGPKLEYMNIKQAEESMERRIPIEYIEFLLLYNGGHPERCEFYESVTDCPWGVELFYGIGGKNKCDLVGVCKEYESRMPKELLPIANTGGCQICICTEGENTGKIFFWDSEEEIPEAEQPCYENVYFLAASLMVFLEELK